MSVDDSSVPERRSIWSAMRRGFGKRCPCCGAGAIFKGYTAVHAHCGTCRLALHHQRADDAPPYFTVLVVGHIIVPLSLVAEQLFEPPVWLQLALWLPLTLVASLALLPRIKGALIGLQWANGMHGFGGRDAD
ncbi:MAG: DUF983 domain-containing protein [Alphaproteobacteria bacterium]